MCGSQICIVIMIFAVHLTDKHNPEELTLWQPVKTEITSKIGTAASLNYGLFY